MAAGRVTFVRATLVATLGVALLGLAAPTAGASPVFTDAVTQLSAGGGAITSGATCTVALTLTPATPLPVVENGPAVTLTQSGSATFAKTGAPTDNGTASANVALTAQVASTNGSMRSIDVTAQGTGQLNDELPSSACPRTMYVATHLDAEFAIAQPGILTIHATGNGVVKGSGDVYVSGPLLTQMASASVGGLPSDSLARAFVTPGTYTGSASATLYAGGGSTSASTSGTVGIHISFAPAGSQSAAPTGKATKYLTFPSSRTCASHAVVPTVTGKKSRAKKVKQVEFFLGTHRVAKVKKPKAGAAVTVPLPDNQDADVRAEVTLFPKHKGHKAKVLAATAGYVACTV